MRPITKAYPSVALFLFLVGGLSIAPIWLVANPPLLDYPNHLARSFVLAHLHDPALPFHQFYSADWGLYPYLAMDVSLLWLQRFLPIELAGSVFLSFCVLAVPLSAWFFLHQANPGQDHLALWTLLLCHNVFFLYGFLNFYLSLALCFLALGLWLQWLAKPRAILWCLVSLTLTALYFTHLVGFGIAGLLVTAYCVLARRTIGEILFSCLLFVPGALFLLYWWRSGAGPTTQLAFHSFMEKVKYLSVIAQGYSTRLDQFTLLALAGFSLAAWWRNPDFRWNYRWLGVAAGLFGAYWVLPWSAGEGAFLDIRVLPMLFVLLLTVARIGPRGWRLAPLAVLIFVARTANVAQTFVSSQLQLAGLARSFSITAPNVRVLPIVEAHDEELARHPFAHFWAYGVIRRGWFSPYLFNLKGVMPLRIEYDGYSPDGFWGLDYEESPDWARVQKDYDYVWAYNVSRFSDSLETIGELVYEYGDLEVYRLNKFDGEFSESTPDKKKADSSVARSSKAH